MIYLTSLILFAKNFNVRVVLLFNCLMSNVKVFATRTQTMLDILWYLKLITCLSDKDCRQRFSHMFACLKMVFVKI